MFYDLRSESQSKKPKIDSLKYWKDYLKINNSTIRFDIWKDMMLT